MTAPQEYIELTDRFASSLNQIERRSERNTLAVLQRSLNNVLLDLRRSYVRYLDDLGPQGYDPNRNTIRRPGEYSVLEATAKFRAIIHDAAKFLTEPEVQMWAIAYERDLRDATNLGGELGARLAALTGQPTTQTPFTGSDPIVIRAATLRVGALIQGEGYKFRDQLIQIVGEGAARGWAPSRLEIAIRQALNGSRDSKGITKQKGLRQRASLIARTELATAYSQGALAKARERGDAYVRVLASNDERVCPTCASRNARIYPVDRVPLPWHPRCRCVAVPVPNEAVEERDPARRAVLLDNERWQAEHEKGVKTYTEGRGIDIEKAKKELSRALRTQTATEKVMFKGGKALQESVPLFND